MVNIVIMRTFVKLRKILASHKDLLKKIEDIEKKYDSQFKVVFEAIRQLVREEEKPKINIGFK
jgi:nicotinamide riboside kinase